MSRKPYPWEVVSKFWVRRDIPHPVVGTLRACRVTIHWLRLVGEPGTLSAEIVVSDRDCLTLHWHLSRHDAPADLPDWLRDMALDCKPSWADTTGWPL